MDHAEDLQELNNRAGMCLHHFHGKFFFVYIYLSSFLFTFAAGEVVIRQALGELDVWEIDAKFSFIEHQASTGEQVPLIKDWKDVLNKVGDNQVLLQSIKGLHLFRFHDIFIFKIYF